LLPRALGYGGAIPFVAIALMLHVSDNQDFLRHALLAYGACIVSFLGAIHWGERLSTFGTGKALSARLGWSVVPSLAAWAILAIGGRFALGCSVGLLLTGRSLLRQIPRVAALVCQYAHHIDRHRVYESSERYILKIIKDGRAMLHLHHQLSEQCTYALSLLR
jgi:hypothetical protein